MKKFLITAAFLLAPVITASCASATDKTADTRAVMQEMITTAGFKNGVLRDLKDEKHAKAYGLSSGDLKEGYIYLEDDEEKPDCVILINAKDRETVENIERAVGNTEIGLNDTFEDDKTQADTLNDSVSKTRGNYVFFAASKNVGKLSEVFDKNIKK